MELFISFFIGGLLTAAYIVVLLPANPATRDLVGHFMGVVGLLLMLMTQTLYTLRKRGRWFRLGALRHWLSFHIITGIVGAWLALLHSAFEFRGVAGLSMAMTLLVVMSGFVGRYIYTAIPRLSDGSPAPGQPPERISWFQKLLRWWYFVHIPPGLTLFLLIALHVVTTIYFGALAR